MPVYTAKAYMVYLLLLAYLLNDFVVKVTAWLNAIKTFETEKERFVGKKTVLKDFPFEEMSNSSPSVFSQYFIET
jgi:hypothetical protein